MIFNIDNNFGYFLNIFTITFCILFIFFILFLIFNFLLIRDRKIQMQRWRFWGFSLDDDNKWWKFRRVVKSKEVKFIHVIYIGTSLIFLLSLLISALFIF